MNRNYTQNETPPSNNLAYVDRETRRMHYKQYTYRINFTHAILEDTHHCSIEELDEYLFEFEHLANDERKNKP